MEEIWRPIKGWEDYEISNYGRVYSYKRKRLLNAEQTEKGYLRVWLSNKGKGKHKKIHILVAEAFIPNPYNMPQVNHKDEDKTNNFVYVNIDGTIDIEKSNLEWCDNRYNTLYSMRRRKNVA